MMVLASFQRNFGLLLAPLVFIGFVIYVLHNARKTKPELGSEIELAPNRKPYYDDEQLEGPRLDRYLTIALGLLGVLALGLPLYWLAEPGRQNGQIAAFERVFASRGSALFEANCSSCHAKGAVGGVAAYVLNDKDGKFAANVSWKAPALNNALLRFSRTEVQYVLDHGRAFSPMQPWSTLGGGALNQQQTKNIIDYLQSITLTPNDAQKANSDGIVARLNVERGAKIDQANPQNPGEASQAFQDRIAALKTADAAKVKDAFAKSESQTAALISLGEASGEDAAKLKLGELLFNNTAASGSYSCARCHTPGWSFDQPGVTGKGAFGPELLGVAAKFKDSAQFQQFVAEGCDPGKVYGTVAPDGAQAQCKSGMMPAFGSVYSPEQLDAVVAYASSLNGTQHFDPNPGKDSSK
jgi:mono/diheme cytochrome c family protein